MIHKSANKTFPVIATAGLCFFLSLTFSLSYELFRYSLQLFYFKFSRIFFPYGCNEFKHFELNDNDFCIKT